MMNNIFNYAPKELVMDAFFAWIFKELNENNLTKYKLQFLNDMKIEGFTNKSKITDIKKQECNTDLIITIDNKDILFENKTTSTIHSNQLEEYKNNVPNCHQYIYMKLGYIDFNEKLQAKKHDYIIVGIEDIEKALHPIKDCCQIVEQYYAFLKNKYIEKSENIQKRMLNNDSTVYEVSDAQRIFLSGLYEKLYGKVKFLKFKYAANRGGTPWTQLSIAYTSKLYGEKGESIFWRIDKKKEKGYYIALKQYADIIDTYKEQKKKRLNILRICFNKLLEKKSNLHAGKVSNRGIKSSEIAIFYFEDNKHEQLSSKLKELSIEFEKEYTTLCKSSSY